MLLGAGSTFGDDVDVAEYGKGCRRRHVCVLGGLHDCPGDDTWKKGEWVFGTLLKTGVQGKVVKFWNCPGTTAVETSWDYPRTES